MYVGKVRGPTFVVGLRLVEDSGLPPVSLKTLILVSCQQEPKLSRRR